VEVNVDEKRATAAKIAGDLHAAAAERAIVGALRAAIHDHGPITPEQIGSAAKRVAGNLRNARIPATVPRPRAGRPPLGHGGHAGDARSCAACRLRRARERLGLTQAEMAARLRVSHRSVQRWERAPAAVDPTALQLAELLAR